VRDHAVVQLQIERKQSEVGRGLSGRHGVSCL
jgi:hypothetical protein